MTEKLDNTKLNVEEIRISVNELCPEMILARDVMTEAGILLLPKDTVLGISTYNKLLSSRIKYVYIKEYSITKEKLPFHSDFNSKPAKQSKSKTDDKISDKMSDKMSIEDISLKRIPVEQRIEFQDFQKEYIIRTEEMKSYIHALNEGKQIDVSQVFDTTNSIMKKLKYKNEIFTYLNFLKNKNEQIYAHSANVALLANLFGQWLGYGKRALMHLTAAGALHDIGKTQIPDEILNKSEELTIDELRILKSHPILGYKMIEMHNLHPDIKSSVIMHHERINGSGYPQGLKGENINYTAKIIAICDMYDYITADRSRKQFCPFDVIKQFEQFSFGIIDTEMLSIFLENIAYTYIGSWVRLNDGREGEIIFINRNDLSRPIIKTRESFIDLSRNQNFKINEIF